MCVCVPNTKDNSYGQEQAPVGPIDVEAPNDTLCKMLSSCFLLKRMRKGIQESLSLNHIHV